MADDVDHERVSDILDGFWRRFENRVSLARERALEEDILVELRPVVEAMLFARSSAGYGPSTPAHHESQAMLLLLGRRAGSLDLSTTAALELAPALIHGFLEAGAELPDSISNRLLSMCMEGYVAGREDRLAEIAAERAVDSQPIVMLAPRVLALFLAGEQEAEVIREVVDRLGRKLHRTDAAGCIVHLEGLEAPSPDRAAEVFGADVGARMLGATCVFVGASPEWLDAARRGRVELDPLCFESDLTGGLARVLPVAGLELRPVGWLPRRLKSLLGRRP